jgi:hypothetical protein
LLHRFPELGMRAVEDVNLGQVFQIELVDQIHRAAAVWAGWRGCDFGHGQGARVGWGQVGANF